MNCLTESDLNFTCVGNFSHIFLVLKQAHAQDAFNKTGNVRINLTLKARSRNQCCCKIIFFFSWRYNLHWGFILQPSSGL